MERLQAQLHIKRSHTVSGALSPLANVAVNLEHGEHTFSYFDPSCENRAAEDDESSVTRKFS